MYTLISGSTTDVLTLSDVLDAFLVDSIGWARQYTVASGVAVRDRVYLTTGYPNNAYNPVYTRVRAESGCLYHYAYTYYSTDGSSWSDELGGSEYESNPGCLNGSCSYWLVADLEAFWCIIKNPVSGTYYSSGAGYSTSYFCPSADPYPVWIAGQVLDNYTFMDSRIKMYDYNGASVKYVVENFSGLLVNGAPQSRSGEYFVMSLPLMNTSAGVLEMRGELRGIKQVYGSLDQERLFSVSGTSPPEFYLFIKHGSSTNAFVYGPLVA